MLVLLAVGAARTVISRMSNARALEEGTAERAKQYVKVAVPKAGDAGQTLSLPGNAAGLRPVADRGARERLPAPLVQGHRQPRREGRAARRDRNARDRPAAVAGDRRAAAGRGEPRAREEHRRALGKPAQEGRGLAAGARRAAQRQRAGGRQSRRRRRQRRTAAPARRLQAHRGAVRRRDHAAQRRRRRPDRRRQQRRPRAVPARADRSAARLRERAADVCAAHQARPEGGRDAGRAARPHVRGRGRAHVGVDRHDHAHDADRSGAAQSRRHAAAGRLRAGRAAAGRRASRC